MITRLSIKPTYFNKVARSKYICPRCGEIKPLDDFAHEMVLSNMIYCEECKGDFLMDRLASHYSNRWCRRTTIIQHPYTKAWLVLYNSKLVHRGTKKECERVASLYEPDTSLELSARTLTTRRVKMAKWNYETKDGKAGTVDAISKSEASKRVREELGIDRIPYGTKIVNVKGGTPHPVIPGKIQTPPPTAGKDPSMPIDLKLSLIEAEDVLDTIVDEPKLVRVIVQLVKELRRR